MDIRSEVTVWRLGCKACERTVKLNENQGQVRLHYLLTLTYSGPTLTCRSSKAMDSVVLALCALFMEDHQLLCDLHNPRVSSGIQCITKLRTEETQKSNSPQAIISVVGLSRITKDSYKYEGSGGNSRPPKGTNGKILIPDPRSLETKYITLYSNS